MVPAPTMTCGLLRARSEMASIAPNTVMVISTIGIPPSVTASAAKRASSPENRRRAGMMPISSMRVRTFCFSIRSNSACEANRVLKNILYARSGGAIGSSQGIHISAIGETNIRGGAIRCPLAQSSGRWLASSSQRPNVN